jgi:hypothetical protein
MQKLILLVVGAVWLAVLVPPLMRSRGESRPDSSVDHFRRRLAILQKSTPARIHPMQSAARPLAGPRAVSGLNYSRTATRIDAPATRLRRSGLDTSARLDRGDRSAALERRSAPRSSRPSLRQRRESVVKALFSVSLASGVLAYMARSTALMYVCALSVVALVGYCGQLLRLRREAELYANRRYDRY